MQTAFPKVCKENCRQDNARQSDDRYNCIAFAIGNDRLWIWPSGKKGQYWPEGIQRDESVEAFSAMFEYFGFQPCAMTDFRGDIHQIVIYANEVKGVLRVTHAAKRIDDLWWHSKLGRQLAVYHHLNALDGPDDYGLPYAFMAKPKG